MNKWKSNDAKVPVYDWTGVLEKEAYEQASNLSQLPFAFHHVALMPDCHAGYGMPIGGVLATKGVIIPNAVGVDIGCGMVALQTDLCAEVLNEELLKKIVGDVRRQIPVGFAKRIDEINWANERIYREGILPDEVLHNNYPNSTLQVGTLGGGNHFIEIQVDEAGFVWLMIHSGSRNLGKQVCDHYNKLAKGLNEKYFSSIPVKYDLSFLPVDSKEGQAYINAMNVCLQFAYENRELMISTLFDIIESYVSPFSMNAISRVNAHHNYAALEHHYGENVWVHRKGAIRARLDDIGIIPGSMGTPSYIVKGLGNAQSFYSASHGAGRVMSRRKANETITEEMANKSIEGVVYGRWNGKYDECPLCYKDIESVMQNQQDLVVPLVKLHPLAVVKG